MKKTIIICDRCKQEAVQAEREVGEISFKKLPSRDTKQMDLCNVCFRDLEIFLERKPLIDLRKILK